MPLLRLENFWLALAIFTILLGAIQIGRELKRRRRAEHAMHEALASVEQQVAERTRELSQAITEVKRSEQQFRLITDLSPVHLFRATPDGEATFLSPGFLAMTGLSPDQGRGFGWLEAIHPDDRQRLLTGWHEALQSQTAFQAEFRFRSAAGDFRWYRARVTPERNESTGAVNGWVGAAIDLHELHLALEERAAALERAEEARRLAEEASHLKDEFLATASHELRTPLNAIVGWVHVLQSDALPDEEQRKHAVDAIDRNARIQTRLIEDLLDVSRMVQGRLSLTVAPLDVRAVVDAALDTVKAAAAAKQITINVHSGTEPITVIGDDNRLQQIVWNLLANAVKYTAKGGTVGVEVLRTGSRAELRVTDSGEGIAADFLPHIFEPFRQGLSRTMRSGLGLGLATVRRLVDLHGGRITASSAGAGQGSEFTVSLPMAQGAALFAARPAAREPVFNGLHVLVAEDDADSAAALTAILKLHGCDTRTASTASECLRMTGEWPTDVLLCDVGLPDDDGYGLLRRLRSLPEGAGIPAIALTAYARPEDRARALAAGFRAHLTKPFEPGRLLEEISSAIRPQAPH